MFIAVTKRIAQRNCCSGIAGSEETDDLLTVRGGEGERARKLDEACHRFGQPFWRGELKLSVLQASRSDPNLNCRVDPTALDFDFETRVQRPVRIAFLDILAFHPCLDFLKRCSLKTDTNLWLRMPTAQSNARFAPAAIFDASHGLAVQDHELSLMAGDLGAQVQ
ncbi:hypothetical protein [Silicimonas sp. MF1-12-2]|uniref:hypothetical protein n=1 Tax=Silicimonas sp. MF1-12-2 TaxID=3384793 RepID=UPI0039B4CE69